MKSWKKTVEVRGYVIEYDAVDVWVPCAMLYLYFMVGIGIEIAKRL